MQSVAQDWLVLKLSGSGTALGVVSALQYLPILLLSPFGGLVADRLPKRTILFFTQAVSGLLALILGALVITDLVQLWMVFVLAFLLGVTSAFDYPARQSFVVELVGDDRLQNAVVLYSTLVNLSRIIGPGLAGLLISTLGIGLCFILNGLSYTAVIWMLYRMRTAELHHEWAEAEPGGRSNLREGLRYVLNNPLLRGTLMMMVIVGCLTFEFQVSLPLIARYTFGGDAQDYAVLSMALGVGAVIGGLVTAGGKRVSSAGLVKGALYFGLAILAASLMPSLLLTALAMAVVGVFSIRFTSQANSFLQLNSAPNMRGRVMSFWATAFLGSTTFGGPIVGWFGERIGPRWALGIGGAAAAAAAVLGWKALELGRRKGEASGE